MIDWVVLLLVVLLIVGFLASFIVLTLYARRNDPGLLRVNVAGLSYVLFLIGLYGGDWSGYFATALFAGGLFAIVYAKYALDFFKKRNRLAYVTLIMAVIFSQVFTILYVRSDLQRRLSNVSELGDQYP